MVRPASAPSLLLLLLLLVLASFAVFPTGATIYNLTPSSNWQTILSNSLLPGDRVVFSSDNFDISNVLVTVNAWGTPSAPITFSGGALFRQQDGSAFPVWALNGAYFSLSGLSFRGGISGLQIKNASNFVASNIFIRDSTQHCVDVTQTIVSNVTFQDSEFAKCGSSGSYHCIRFGATDGQWYCSACQVLQCYIHECGSHGIYSPPNSSAMVFADNVIRSFASAGIRTNDDFDLGGGVRTKVQRNLIYASSSANGILFTANTDVESNILVISSPTSSAIRQDSQTYKAPGPRNFQVAHNTIVGSCGAFSAIAVSPVGGALPNSIIVNNAAVCSSTAASIRTGQATAVTGLSYASNVISTTPMPVGAPANSGVQSTALAEFLNSTWDNYPRSTAVCVSGISSSGYSQYDYNGTPRSGSSPTVGAYEYTSPTNPSTPIAAAFKPKPFFLSTTPSSTTTSAATTTPSSSTTTTTSTTTASGSTTPSPTTTTPSSSTPSSTDTTTSQQTTTTSATTAPVDTTPAQTTVPPGRCALSEIDSTCGTGVVSEPTSVGQNISIPIISITTDGSGAAVNSSACISAENITLVLTSDIPTNGTIPLIDALNCRPNISGNVIVTYANNTEVAICGNAELVYDNKNGLLSVLLPGGGKGCTRKKKRKNLKWWVLGGCLLVVLLTAVLLFAFWRYSKQPQRQRSRIHVNSSSDGASGSSLTGP